MTLEEYAAKNADRIREQAARMEAKEAEERQQYREEKAKQEARRACGLALLPTLADELAAGTPYKYCLFTAIKALGLLSGDEEWSEAAAALLGDPEELEQEAGAAEAAAEAAGRADDLREEYARKVSKALGAQIKALKGCLEELEQAQRSIDGWGIF